MNSYNQSFEARLIKMLGDHRQEKAEDLVAGVPIERYREEVGYIRGLNEALKMIEEVRAELRQG